MEVTLYQTNAKDWITRFGKGSIVSDKLDRRWNCFGQDKWRTVRQNNFAFENDNLHFVLNTISKQEQIKKHDAGYTQMSLADFAKSDIFQWIRQN